MKGLFVYTEERSWKTQSSTVASLNIKSTRIIHSSPGHNMSSLTVHCPIVSSAYPFSNPGLDAVSNASVLFLGQPTMIVTLPPIAVIANISRPKHAVQQPASHPVGTVLARGVAPLEQRPRQGPGVPRDLHNAPALSLRTDMMPEKGGRVLGSFLTLSSRSEVSWFIRLYTTIASSCTYSAYCTYNTFSHLHIDIWRHTLIAR